MKNLRLLNLIDSPYLAYIQFTFSDGTISIEPPPSKLLPDGFLIFTNLPGVIAAREEMEKVRGSSLTISQAKIVIDPRKHIGYVCRPTGSFITHIPNPVPADQFVNPYIPIYQGEFFPLCSSGKDNPEINDYEDILKDCQSIIEKQLWLGNRLCKFANVFSLACIRREKVYTDTIIIGLVPKLMLPSKKRTTLVNRLIKLQEDKLSLLRQLK